MSASEFSCKIAPSDINSSQLLEKGTHHQKMDQFKMYCILLRLNEDDVVKMELVEMKEIYRVNIGRELTETLVSSKFLSSLTVATLQNLCVSRVGRKPKTRESCLRALSKQKPSDEFIIGEESWVDVSKKSNEIIGREGILGELGKQLCQQKQDLEGVKRKIASHIFAKAIEDLNSDEANDSDIPTYIRNKYGPLLLDVYARSKFKEQAYDQIMFPTKEMCDDKLKKEQRSRRDEIARVIKDEIVSSVMILWAKRDEIVRVVDSNDAQIDASCTPTLATLGLPPPSSSTVMNSSPIEATSCVLQLTSSPMEVTSCVVPTPQLTSPPMEVTPSVSTYLSLVSSPSILFITPQIISNGYSDISPPLVQQSLDTLRPRLKINWLTDISASASDSLFAETALGTIGKERKRAIAVEKRAKAKERKQDSRIDEYETCKNPHYAQIYLCDVTNQECFNPNPLRKCGKYKLGKLNGDNRMSRQFISRSRQTCPWNNIHGWSFKPLTKEGTELSKGLLAKMTIGLEKKIASRFRCVWMTKELFWKYNFDKTEVGINEIKSIILEEVCRTALANGAKELTIHATNLPQTFSADMYKKENAQPSDSYLMFDESALVYKDIILDESQMKRYHSSPNESLSQPMSQCSQPLIACDNLLIHGVCDSHNCPHEHDDHAILRARGLQLISNIEEELRRYPAYADDDANKRDESSAGGSSSETDVDPAHADDNANKRDESSAGGSSSERDVDEDSDTLNFSECHSFYKLVRERPPLRFDSNPILVKDPFDFSDILTAASWQLIVNAIVARVKNPNATILLWVMGTIHPAEVLTINFYFNKLGQQFKMIIYEHRVACLTLLRNSRLPNSVEVINFDLRHNDFSHTQECPNFVYCSRYLMSFCLARVSQHAIKQSWQTTEILADNTTTSSLNLPLMRCVKKMCSISPLYQEEVQTPHEFDFSNHPDDQLFAKQLNIIKCSDLHSETFRSSVVSYLHSYFRNVFDQIDSKFRGLWSANPKSLSTSVKAFLFTYAQSLIKDQHQRVKDVAFVDLFMLGDCRIELSEDVQEKLYKFDAQQMKFCASEELAGDIVDAAYSALDSIGETFTHGLSAMAKVVHPACGYAYLFNLPSLELLREILLSTIFSDFDESYQGCDSSRPFVILKKNLGKMDALDNADVVIFRCTLEDPKHSEAIFGPLHCSQGPVLHVADMKRLAIDEHGENSSKFWANNHLIHYFFYLVMHEINSVRAFNEDAIKELLGKEHELTEEELIILAKRTCLSGPNESQEYQILFLPYHISGFHWALVVADFRKTTITYYDSLRTSTSLPNLYQRIILFLCHLNKSTAATDWKIDSVCCPRQDNGIDCGYFVMLFAAYFAHSKIMPPKLSSPQVRTAVIRCIESCSAKQSTILDTCDQVFSKLALTKRGRRDLGHTSATNPLIDDGGRGSGEDWSDSDSDSDKDSKRKRKKKKAEAEQKKKKKLQQMKKAQAEKKSDKLQTTETTYVVREEAEFSC